MADSLIIGAVTGYKYDDIAPWLNSIKQSGFTGKTGLIIYNMELAEIEKLNAAGLDYSFVIQQDPDGNAVYDNPNFNICVERFAHLWFFLKKYEDPFDYVIATDVKDVVFQSNPSEWIREITDNHEDPLIIVGTENLLYKDEPWGKNNMIMSFGPLFYDELKDTPIHCAGVIAGTRQSIQDLAKTVFLVSRGGPAYPSGGGGPDQAALNITLNTDPWKRMTAFLESDEPFVAHCGTSWEAIKAGSGAIGEEFVQLHTSTEMQIKDRFVGPDLEFINGQVCTENGVPFCIVHQYDRVPEWKKVILEKYGAV